MTRKSVPRVLIVDDDSAIRQLLATVCRRMGFECESAGDGAEALEKLAVIRFDVMLLDLMMPRVSGYDVINALRGTQERPAVIVVTAQGAKQTTGLAHDDVVHAIVTKPFELPELCQLLREIAARMRPHEPDPAVGPEP